MTNRRAGRQGLLATAIVGSLLLGAAGCGEDGNGDGPPEDYKVVTGTHLCGGNAISPDATKALTVITGQSKFEASGDKETVKRAATELAALFLNPHGRYGDICRIHTPRNAPDFELRITWRLEDGPPKGGRTPNPEFTMLKMGEESAAASYTAYISFMCRSKRLAKVGGVTHMSVEARYWGIRPERPEGNVPALKDAYATVAHSFSLAMAKELHCDKNGGLPDHPVLDPA